MAEYYLIKVCAGITAGFLVFAVFAFIAIICTFTDKFYHPDFICKVFKVAFTISGIVLIITPFFAGNAEYHIIHNGRNYFTNEIIYLKDGGIHFQGVYLFEGGCITIDDDYIIKKI